jgi:hypothetical protein
MSAAINGPLRSAATDTATTTAAVITALKASPYQKNGSGGIQLPKATCPRRRRGMVTNVLVMHSRATSIAQRLPDHPLARMMA